MQQWETKANELCQLAQKYHTHLDLQHQNMNKMKVMLSEKDTLIAELHDSLQQRDYVHD